MKFKTAALLTSAFAFILSTGNAKAWDVNNWMDRANATTCSEIVQTSAYFLGKYYSTGNSKFKELSNEKIAEAKSKGCK